MMKTIFSRVVALGVLVCASTSSWAQTKVAPDSGFSSFGKKVKWSSADALAMIGAFHSKVHRAESYRGQVTIVASSVLTTLKNEKIIEKITNKSQSIWVRDAKPEGTISRSVDSRIKIVNSIDGTFSGTSKIVNDGTKIYELSNKYWEVLDEETASIPLSLYLIRRSWKSALSSVNAGRKLTVKRQIVSGREQLSIKDALSKQWILDFRTGDLLYFVERGNGNTQEVRWSKQEFDLKLPDSTFVWKIPQGAKQIVPTDPGVKVVS